MKKLMLGLLLLLSTPAYAGLIDLPSYISGNDVTIANLQTTNTTIENFANGNVEGGGINIKAGSITSYDLAVSINPVQRWDESFSDFTYTGMLPVTSGSLTSNISAGTSYINGYRVVTSSTAHTYTASKDTYVYIHQGGYFVYQEVANGASAPSTPSNTLLLAKVVSSGSALTTVSDLRTLSIQITATTSNFPSDYRSQSYVSRDTTINFYVAPGNVSIGTTIYNKTANTTTRTITTGSNWIEGGYPTGYAGNVFVYAYNDAGSTYDFKFSSADVAYSDTSLNTAGVKKYYVNSNVNYRALGWAYLSADVVQLYQTSNVKDPGVPNIIEYNNSTASSTASTNFVNDSNLPMFRFYSSGGIVTINYSAAIDNSGSDFTVIGIMIDSVDIASTSREGLGNSGTTRTLGYSTTWTGVLSRGVHSIQGRFKAVGNTAYINKRTFTIRED